LTDMFPFKDGVFVVRCKFHGILGPPQAKKFDGDRICPIQAPPNILAHRRRKFFGFQIFLVEKDEKATGPPSSPDFWDRGIFTTKDSYQVNFRLILRKLCRFCIQKNFETPKLCFFFFVFQRKIKFQSKLVSATVFFFSSGKFVTDRYFTSH
jgi:hypothetical protein